MGHTVDMSALAKKNELVRAAGAGGTNVNARGDTIDASGKVIVPVTAKVNEQYAHTVGNKSAQVTRPPAAPINRVVPPTPTPAAEEVHELTALERELEAEDDAEEAAAAEEDQAVQPPRKNALRHPKAKQ